MNARGVDDGATGWRAWADACRRETGLALELCEYPPGAARRTERRPGDWWRHGEAWCVHLDAETYGRIDANVPEAVRRLLSFSVRREAAFSMPDWRQQVRTWALALSRLPSAALLAAYEGTPGWIGGRGQADAAATARGAGRTVRDAGGQRETTDVAKGMPELDEIARQVGQVLTLPGWFVWLDVDGPAVAGPDAEADVQEAVEGFLPSGLLCWLTDSDGHGRAPLSALLLWPLSAAEEAAADVDDTPEAYAMDRVGTDDDGGAVLSGGGGNRGRDAAIGANAADMTSDLVRRSVRQLVQVLAADGMAARASIGRRMDMPGHVWRGLVTVVMAHRQHAWLAAEGLVRDGVSTWSDQPLVWLAAGSPDSGRHWLADAASDRRDVAGIWSDEVWDTLQGMMSADLNVSEAARRLYLHRNTLLNRIERIRAATGYDLRRFRDAAELWWLWTMRRTHADS